MSPSWLRGAQRMADEQLRVLMTNDDGVHAPALDLLAAALVGRGFDVRIVAPTHEYTGCGASIGHMSEGAFVATNAVRLERSGVTAISVAGPPALAVMVGCSGEFGPVPDVVVSGINNGLNTGRVILHSGTLGGALTAGAAGVHAMAVSTARDAQHGFATGVEFVARVIQPFVEHEPPGTVVNVNVPDLPIDRVAGVSATSLAEQSAVSLAISRSVDGVILRRTTLDRPAECRDSDVAALQAGQVSVTRVHPGVCGLPPGKAESWMS